MFKLTLLLSSRKDIIYNMKDDEIFNHWGGPSCPIDSTLELIGRKWVIAIIRDMFMGKKHFNEFKKDKPNLTNSVLSDTLKFMEKKDLIEKRIIDDDGRRTTEYYLTDKSKKLNIIIYDLVLYGINVLNCLTDESDDFQNNFKEKYKELLEIK